MSTLLFSALISYAYSPAAANLSVPDVTAVIPRSTPSIIGQITALALPMVVVEENPAEPHGSAKIVVRITDSTQVLRQDESVGGSTELRVGQQVKVWFTGPVMESYPQQATAGIIVIEPSNR